MSQFGQSRENNPSTKPSEEREDFFEDDGVSDVENSIESYIRDLKKLILLCTSMIETLQTDVGRDVYSAIKDLAEKIIEKLESIKESDLKSASTFDTIVFVEDFMIDQDALIDMFGNTEDYKEEDILMNIESMKEVYGNI